MGAWLFGTPMTTSQLLAKQRDALNDVRRILERSSRRAIDRAAKADTAARNNAKLGNISAARQHALDRQRAMRHALAFQKQAAEIEEVLAATTLQEAAMNTQTAMTRIAAVMRRAQLLMPGTQFARVMAQYSADTSAVQLKQETAIDAASMAFNDMEHDDNGSEEEAEDARVDAYLQEIGASEADKLLAQMPSVPGATNGQSTQRPAKLASGAGGRRNWDDE